MEKTIRVTGKGQVSVPPDKIRLKINLEDTEQDRELLTSIEIPLEPVHYIAYQGAKYKVESNTDYSDFAGFYAYNLKRVRAFDR